METRRTPAESCTAAPLSDKGTHSHVTLTVHDWWAVADTLRERHLMKADAIKEACEGKALNEPVTRRIYTAELREIVAALHILGWFR